MVRSIQMIPFYGCGVGLASAMMSRIYAITMPIHPRLKMRMVRVIWRGDTEGVAQLTRTLRARAAAQVSAGVGSGGEAPRAGV
jgi:hypothetical protein